MDLTHVFSLAFGALPDAPPEDEIQALLAAARRGAPDAARRLYRLFVDRVYRAVRSLSASDADAEEVTQDSFVKAFAALDRYRPRAGKPFLAWLMTIALNTARSRGRRLARRARREAPAPEHEPQDASAPDPEERLLRRELRRVLLDALAGLPERDREVVVLRYCSGLKAPAVAEALGLQAANVRKICQRRRSELAAILEPYLNENGEVRR